VRCPSHEQLSAYVDKELTLSQMQKIDIHLQDCLTCRIEVSRLERLISNFKVLARESISIPNIHLVPTSTRSQRWAAVVALVLLLAGGAIVLGYSNENTIATNNEEFEYYYNNHNNYVRNQNTDFISLVSWE